MTNDKSQGITLEREEASDLVNEAMEEVTEVLRKHLGPVRLEQRWLLVARIFNLLFAQIYKPQISMMGAHFDADDFKVGKSKPNKT